MLRLKTNCWRNYLPAVAAMAGALSLGAAPVWAQQSGSDKSRASERPSSSRQQDRMAGRMVPANDLQDQKVLDAQNREVGTITNLFIDPQSGRIQRVDIDFSGSMFQGDHKYSVAWDKLTVKERGKDVVVTLNDSIIKRVQQAGATGKVTEGDGIYSRQARDGGMLGTSAMGKERRQISASQLSAEQIRKIQQKLNQQGFHAGQVNGKWSTETQTAVSNFQQTKGLKTTGQLDEQTLDQLGLDADEFRSNDRPRAGASGSSR
jgi:sporulation protein YlmC with PRC-barrel domain